MVRTSASRIAAACALGLALLWAPAASSEAQQPQTVPASGAARPAEAVAPASASHYIEFRVATIGTYGHSYVAYGRLNGRGQPAETHYADLHPTGSYVLMALGHVLPVPANTEWDDDVLKLPIASSYRRKLNAGEYQKLLAAVQRARANKQPYWNAITNNCNHFIAELARAIGLRAPTDLQISYAFVPALRELNESAQQAKPAPLRKPPTADRPPARSAQTPSS